MLYSYLIGQEQYIRADSFLNKKHSYIRDKKKKNCSVLQRITQCCSSVHIISYRSVHKSYNIIYISIFLSYSGNKGWDLTRHSFQKKKKKKHSHFPSCTSSFKPKSEAFTQGSPSLWISKFGGTNLKFPKRQMFKTDIEWQHSKGFHKADLWIYLHAVGSTASRNSGFPDQLNITQPNLTMFTLGFGSFRCSFTAAHEPALASEISSRPRRSPRNWLIDQKRTATNLVALTKKSNWNHDITTASNSRSHRCKHVLLQKQPWTLRQVSEHIQQK